MSRAVLAALTLGVAGALRASVRTGVRSMSGSSVRPPATPRRFYVEPSQALTIATASAPLLLRLGTGATVAGWRPFPERETEDNSGQYSLFSVAGWRLGESSAEFKARPAQPLVLYDLYSCPFCRKVREVIAVLDLDVEMRPCPRNGPTYRPEAVELSGKSMFPFLRDPNTGKDMLESDDIIAYLWETYGPVDGSSPPLMSRLGLLTVLTAGLSALPSLGAGGSYREGKLRPTKPLELYGYDASPFTAVVRWRLNELEIPHLFRTCARGSANRNKLQELTGQQFQVPYLIDPNTGYASFESASINEYIEETYGTA